MEDRRTTRLILHRRQKGTTPLRTRKRGPRWVLAEGRQNASEPIKLPANDVRMKNRRRLMYRMPLAGLTETLGRLEVPGNRASKYATLATDPPKETPRSRAGQKWRRGGRHWSPPVPALSRQRVRHSEATSRWRPQPMAPLPERPALRLARGAARCGHAQDRPGHQDVAVLRRPPTKRHRDR